MMEKIYKENGKRTLNEYYFDYTIYIDWVGEKINKKKSKFSLKINDQLKY